MRRTLPIFALLTARALAVENALPSAYSPERYEKMLEKSPFALATPVVPVAAPEASFALNWYLTGAGRDEQGIEFVSITNQDRSVNLLLTGSEERDGVTLDSITWAEGKKTVAKVRKGLETARLEFNQSEVAVPAPQPPGGRPVLPGALGGVPGGNGQLNGRPLGGPQGSGTQPRLQLPRPTGAPITAPVAAPVPQPGQNPGAIIQPVGENRRRVRSIPAPQ